MVCSVSRGILTVLRGKVIVSIDILYYPGVRSQYDKYYEVCSYHTEECIGVGTGGAGGAIAPNILGRGA